MADGWKAQYYDFTLSLQRKSDGSWDISAERPPLKIKLETSEYDEDEAKTSAACLAHGYLFYREHDGRPFLAELSWIAI